MGSFEGSAELQDDVAPRFYSVAQVARLFGMSSMTVYRAIAAGEFPAVRIRGRLIIPARALDSMVDAALAEQAAVDSSGWVPTAAVSHRVTRRDAKEA